MCINGKPVPIPKGTVWAWKCFSGQVQDSNRKTYYKSLIQPFNARLGCWLTASFQRTYGLAGGFHAFQSKSLAERYSLYGGISCGEFIAHVKLRGIIEATTEGYRAKEMLIPKPKRRSRKAKSH